MAGVCDFGVLEVTFGVGSEAEAGLFGTLFPLLTWFLTIEGLDTALNLGRRDGGGDTLEAGLYGPNTMLLLTCHLLLVDVTCYNVTFNSMLLVWPLVMHAALLGSHTSEREKANLETCERVT